VEHPPWTLPGVEGKKAKEKGKTFPTLWDDDPPWAWTLPGVEGKKAEEKGGNFDKFLKL
jgi:hypothetical protein